MNPLQNEWAIIHGDIEKYERYSLAIKLFAVLVSLFSIAYLIGAIFSVSLILILWLQDGIWKTFQRRLETRIIFIEKTLMKKQANEDLAFQLYSQWSDNRPGISDLMKGYLFSAIKPTVAYPYALLTVLTLAFYG